MAQQIVLLVDDNPDLRVIGTAILTSHGFVAHGAKNGEQGVEMARLHNPDIIIMDLAMPVMDGWEAVERLKADPATAHIPILAATAYAPSEEEIQEAGFCGLLTKPFPPAYLIGGVEHCLRAVAGGVTWIPRLEREIAAAPNGVL